MKSENIRHFFFLGLFVLLTIQVPRAQAQQRYLEEVSGRPIRIGQYENVHGSAYLLDDWSKGTVELANGKIYNDIELKYNQLEDILLFKGKDGQALAFVQPVVHFTISYGTSDKIFRNGFPAVNNSAEATFYEVLANGKATLLKKTSKVIREEKSYNSATIEKNIIENTNYYISMETGITRIRNNEKSVLAALPDKVPELKAFIKSNKLNLKEEEAMVKLINFYNSI